MRGPKSFAVSCDSWKRLSLWHSRDYCTGKSWESVFTDIVSPWRPSLSGRVCELLTVDRCCEITHKTGYWLLLAGNCSWWGWRRSFPTVQQALMDGLLKKGWTRGSEVEACRADYQSFVQEQRQPERSSTRSRLDVGDVLSFCSAQAGFRARRHLYKVCIVSNHASCFAVFWVFLLLLKRLWCFRCSS